MNQKNTTIKRALISVSNKTGIVEFARELTAMNIEIISTGGTSKLLREQNIPVRDVAEITEFPEMMDGRVKTLHPKIHGGILGLRDAHETIAKQHHIPWIDLVVVNLYPFAATIKNKNATFDDAVENIDIGGPTMIRSAAKNMGWVSVIVDPSDYESFLSELKKNHSVNFNTRKYLATKAFTHTADYDTIIANYLSTTNQAAAFFPSSFDCHLTKTLDLRYGENPHQHAAAYSFEKKSGILSAKQYQGKELSYNNLVDTDAAYACANEFSDPACVIVKHANPCGAAVAKNIDTAFQNAFNADSVSAFGGIVALNRECTASLAEKISQIFFEVIIAPAFNQEALAIFAKKSNLRILELSQPLTTDAQELKFIAGGLLVQDKDAHIIRQEDLKMVTQKKPTPAEIEDLLFAWCIVKHIKSNAILIAKNNSTVGVGAGQVSRIDAVDIALRKAGNNSKETVLASDAFFPFRDSIDRIAHTGINAIIQPGGSVRDEEVIAACDEHGIAMVFTGIRCFKH